jgi:hypothetical protein
MAKTPTPPAATAWTSESGARANAAMYSPQPIQPVA